MTTTIDGVEITSVGRVAQVVPITVQQALHAPGVPPEARQLAQDIADGKAVLCAPFPGMHEPLSEQEIARFVKAMEQPSPIGKGKSKRKKRAARKKTRR